MVWNVANRFLKRTLPGCHGLLKRAAAPWLDAERPVPVPRRVAGHLVWTHPRLLAEPVTEPHVLRWITRTLRPGDSFLDIGAHYGWMSMVAAKRAGRSGHVYAFEPSPALARILKYHRRVNHLSQMELLTMAVSDLDSDAVPFYLVNGGASYRNSLVIGPDDNRHIRPSQKSMILVPSVTLDTFCSSRNVVPQLIKIDVEGAELLVLRGADTTLARHHPVLIVGVHPQWLPPDQTVADIFQFLERRNYWVQASKVIPFEGADFGDYLFA